MWNFDPFSAELQVLCCISLFDGMWFILAQEQLETVILCDFVQVASRSCLHLLKYVQYIHSVKVFFHIYIYIYIYIGEDDCEIVRCEEHWSRYWIVEWFLQYPTLATRWQQHEYVCPSHLVPEVHRWHHLLMDWDLVWSETLPICHHDAAEMT